MTERNTPGLKEKLAAEKAARIDDSVAVERLYAALEEARATIATQAEELKRLRDECDSLRDAIDHPYTNGVVTRAESAEAELTRYREALRGCIEILHRCDYATQRVPLGISSMIHKATAALETPGRGLADQ